MGEWLLTSGDLTLGVLDVSSWKEELGTEKGTFS